MGNDVVRQTSVCSHRSQIYAAQNFLLRQMPRGDMVSSIFSWKEICDTLTIQAAVSGASTANAVEYFPVVGPTCGTRMSHEKHRSLRFAGPLASSSTAPDRTQSLPFADAPNLLDVLGAVGDGAISEVTLKLPDQLISERAALETLPGLASEARTGEEEWFPFHPFGPCNHRVHWNHLRAKRNFSYYRCDLCSVQWRQLRPKVLRQEPSGKVLATDPLGKRLRGT